MSVGHASVELSSMYPSVLGGEALLPKPLLAAWRRIPSKTVLVRIEGQRAEKHSTRLVSTAPLHRRESIRSYDLSNPPSTSKVGGKDPSQRKRQTRDLQGLRRRWATGRGAPEVCLCFTGTRTMLKVRYVWL